MTVPEAGVRVLAPGTTGAPLVVFVHGLEDGWASWRPVADRLGPYWRMLALDLPWRAGNDYRWRQRPAGYWLGRALDPLDTAPDLLVAHSFGANAALELLCARDRRAGHAAVLVCPLYRSPDHPVTWRMFDRSRVAFLRHIRDGVRVRVGARERLLDADLLRSIADAAVDRMGPAGFLAVFEQFVASADLALHNVDVPALVLAGGADPILPPSAAHALGARIDGGRVRVHEHHDHFCHLRQAPDLAAQIAGFVGARTGSAVRGEV